MGNKRKKRTRPPTLSRAMSRLLGAWLGACALAVTYVTAVLSDVGAPTALLRAGVAWLIFFILGRAIGWIAGSVFAASLRAEAPPSGELEAAA